MHPDNAPMPGAERGNFGMLGVARSWRGVPRSLWIDAWATAQPPARREIREQNLMRREHASVCPRGSVKLRANTVQPPRTECHPIHPRRSLGSKKPMHPDNAPMLGAERGDFGMLGVARCWRGVSRSLWIDAWAIALPPALRETREQNLMRREHAFVCPGGSVKLRANTVQLPRNECRPIRPRRSRAIQKSMHPENANPTVGGPTAIAANKSPCAVRHWRRCRTLATCVTTGLSPRHGRSRPIHPDARIQHRPFPGERTPCTQRTHLCRVGLLPPSPSLANLTSSI